MFLKGIILVASLCITSPTFAAEATPPTDANQQKTTETEVKEEAVKEEAVKEEVVKEEAVRKRNWSFTPRLSVGGTYSDNIDLAPDGEEDEDFATQLIPAFKAELQGRRLQAKVDARLQAILYADDSDSDDTFPQYEAAGKTELWRERFFMDAASTISQRIISSRGRRFISNVNTSQNRTNQLTAAFRPYWQQPIGSFAKALIRYEYGFVDFFNSDKEIPEDDLSSSELNNILLSLSNLAKEQPLSWTLDFNNQKITYDESGFDNLRFTMASLELGYRINPSIGLIAKGGYEDNDFGESFTSDDPKGNLWEAGALWQPNSRSKIEGRFGDRFFGSTYRLFWEQQVQRFTTRIRAERTIGGETAFLLRGTTSLIDEPTRRLPLNRLGVTSEVFILERIDASITLNTAKSEYSIGFLLQDREFDNSDDDERFKGFDSSWKWNFLPRSAFTLGLLLGKTEPGDEGGREDEYIRVRAELERQIGPKTTGSLEFTHTTQYSDESSFEYDENALTFFINRTF